MGRPFACRGHREVELPPLLRGFEQKLRFLLFSSLSRSEPSKPGQEQRRLLIQPPYARAAPSGGGPGGEGRGSSTAWPQA